MQHYRTSLTARQNRIVDVVKVFINNHELASEITRMAGLLFHPTFKGHNSRIMHVKLSENNHFIFSSAEAPCASVRMWDVETGQCMREFRHDSDVYCFSFTRNLGLLVTGDSNGTVSMFDISTGSLIHSFSVGVQVTDMLICDNERYLVIVAESEQLDEILYTFDIESKICIRKFNTSEQPDIHWSISPLLFKSKDKSLFLGFSNGWIRQLQFENNELIRWYRGHTSTVTCLTLSEDERFLYSGSTDRLIKKWDTETGACLFTCFGLTSWVSSLAVFEDKIFSGTAGSERCHVAQWSAENGSSTRMIHCGYHVNYVTISNDGFFLIFPDGRDSFKAIKVV